MTNQSEIISTEGEPSTIDYLILMGMIHPLLTILFGTVNPIIYQATDALAQTGKVEWLTAAALLSLIVNFGMQMYTYHDRGITANMTTMVVKEALGTDNKFFPMLVGYITNTALQTFGTPSNYMNVAQVIWNAEPSMLAGLSAQYLSGVITTGAVTGLIYTRKLEPVAHKFTEWRAKGKEYTTERVKKAFERIAKIRDDISSKF